MAFRRRSRSLRARHHAHLPAKPVGSSDSLVHARYIRYEFGIVDVEPVMEAIAILETNYPLAKPPRPAAPAERAASQRALAILSSVQGTMTQTARQAWRWRILYLRAQIDAALFACSTDPAHPLANCVGVRELVDAYAELDEIYHVERSCGGTCVDAAQSDDACANTTWINCTGSVLRPGLYFAGCA